MNLIYLQRVHDLVSFFDAEEVGDVARHFGVVDVRHAELAGAGLRHSNLGEGAFTLAWKMSIFSYLFLKEVCF